MAQETRNGRPYDTPYESNYASYEDQYAEPVDLDTFGSQLRSHHSARSVATREEFLPEGARRRYCAALKSLTSCSETGSL